MLDILEDSTEDEIPTHQSLELDRIKEKIRAIWKQIVIAHCEEMGITEKDKDHYIEEHNLYFSGDPEPEASEIENLVNMLDGLLVSDEELEPVKKGGKAPSYKGSDLKANKEKGKIGSTVYEVSHISTLTPSDKQTKARSSGYDKPTGGRLSFRKDSKVKETISPFVEHMKGELNSLEDRQRIGRRRQLFR